MKKNKRCSELKFKDFSEFNNFIRVTWNGKVIYDDDVNDYDDLKEMEKKYADKAVYSMFVQVVSIHHTALVIEGEE